MGRLAPGPGGQMRDVARFLFIYAYPTEEEAIRDIRFIKHWGHGAVGRVPVLPAGAGMLRSSPAKHCKFRQSGMP